MNTVLAPPPPVRPAVVADPMPTPDLPAPCSVTAHVAGGLDGALRVMTMLRGRRYRVRRLVLDIAEGAVESRVTGTVVLTAADLDLLLTRLRRCPLVVAAEGC